MEQETLSAKINMEKECADYAQHSTSSPLTMEAEQKYMQVHNLVAELDKGLALEDVVVKVVNVYKQQGFNAGYITALTIGKDVLDKVSGLTDLLFCLSDTLELGGTFRKESAILLATISQGIENDLKKVLKEE